MKKWEDIVKERLEGYESTLPEGSFAAFRARRDGVGTSSSRRRIAPWIWGLSAAVAAGLASVLFLRFPETDGGMETGLQPDGPIVEVVAEPVLAGTDSSFVDVPDVSRRVAQVVTPKPVQETVVQEPVVSSGIDDASIIPSVVDSSATSNEFVDETEPVAASPFIPASAEDTPSVHLNIAPVAGGVLGVGALAALAASLGVSKDLMEPSPQSDSQYSGNPHWLFPDETGPGISDGVLKGVSHHFPLKAGLTTRIPLAGRLYLTTGLDYSRYSSLFTYQFVGEKKQVVQYLGIPVRLDWAFVSGKWMDVYVGGGLLGDVCIGASLGGEKIRRDGLSLSAMGAGGVQWNVSKRLGLYIEPALNWRIPLGTPVLETYRTAHPLTFTTAAGLRINLDK
ncbi:MAG: hypothetical protein J6P46_08385 [Bacteroidales bacterium]|nr:hypothetical protein [Bacteroidales bacterium]